MEKWKNGERNSYNNFFWHVGARARAKVCMAQTASSPAGGRPVVSRFNAPETITAKLTIGLSQGKAVLFTILIDFPVHNNYTYISITRHSF
jgi:hypothetical protein